MFAKLATALNPLKLYANRCYTPVQNITSLKHHEWRALQPGIDLATFQLPVPVRRSMTELCSQLAYRSKNLMWFAKHFTREYREKTTPLQIFMPCNLSSCRVWHKHKEPIRFQNKKWGMGIKQFNAIVGKRMGCWLLEKPRINFEGTKAKVNDISKEWVCQQYFISKVYYDMFAWW